MPLADLLALWQAVAERLLAGGSGEKLGTWAEDSDKLCQLRNSTIQANEI